MGGRPRPRPGRQREAPSDLALRLRDEAGGGAGPDRTARPTRPRQLCPAVTADLRRLPRGRVVAGQAVDDQADHAGFLRDARAQAPGPEAREGRAVGARARPPQRLLRRAAGTPGAGTARAGCHPPASGSSTPPCTSRWPTPCAGGTWPGTQPRGPTRPRRSRRGCRCGRLRRSATSSRQRRRTPSTPPGGWPPPPGCAGASCSACGGGTWTCWPVPSTCARSAPWPDRRSSSCRPRPRRASGRSPSTR